MESSKIALIDMDGTICDYSGQMERDLSEISSPEEPKYKLNWDDRLPCHVLKRIKLIKNSKDWWLNLPKLEDGFDLVEAALEIGFEIHVATKGPKNTKTAWTQKVQWCAENLPKGTNVTITHDKSLLYGRILIDDYPVYVKSWLKNRPRGLAIMPLREWNKNFNHPNAIHYDNTQPANRYGSFSFVYQKMQEQFDRK